MIKYTMKSVLLAFGSNLGNRQHTLENAYIEIGKLPDTKFVRISRFYETKPVGGPAGTAVSGTIAGINRNRNSLLKTFIAVSVKTSKDKN
ncbi:hypothetical protein FACS189427_02000 [Planctomycetales bacterium]|nr:hypothetical protein FACS189427_02000 [Planctomycetales bacterium]